jgi:hypothetical protein
MCCLPALIRIKKQVVAGNQIKEITCRDAAVEYQRSIFKPRICKQYSRKFETSLKEEK